MIADGGEIVIEKKPINIGKPLVVILIVASVFVMALGIGIGVSIFAPRNNGSQTDNNNKITPTPTDVPKITSKLATDPAVIQLKSDIEGFATELDRVDLNEPQLAPPNIDLNISIGVQ